MDAIQHDFNLIMSAASIGSTNHIVAKCKYGGQIAELNTLLAPHGLRAYRPAFISACGCCDLFYKRI